MRFLSNFKLIIEILFNWNVFIQRELWLNSQDVYLHVNSQ